MIKDEFSTHKNEDNRRRSRYASLGMHMRHAPVTLHLIYSVSTVDVYLYLFTSLREKYKVLMKLLYL